MEPSRTEAKKGEAIRRGDVSGRDEFHELCYYTLRHPGPSFIHQHVVDAYAAQTGGADTKPIKLAFALIGLYLHIERRFSGKEVQRAHMRLARRRRPWRRFDLPEARGRVTVSDVLAAPPGPARDEAIDHWCVSVWEAYGESHEAVAELVDSELGSRPGPKR